MKIINRLKNVKKDSVVFFFLLVLISLSYPTTFKYTLPFLSLFFLIKWILFYKKNEENLIANNFYLLVFSLIFFRSIHSLLLVYLLGLLIIYSTRKKERKSIKLKKQFSLTILFFLLIAINLFIFNSKFRGLDTYFYIIFYPLLFLFLKRLQITFSFKKTIKYFIYSIIVVIIQLLFLNYVDGSLILNNHTFFSTYLDLTHVYFGLFIATAISLLLVLIESKTYCFSKILDCILIIIFLLVISYIGARMALLASIFVICLFIFKSIKISTFKKVIYLSFFIVSVSIISYKIIPRLKDDVYYTKNVYQSIVNNNKQDIILNSWRNMYQRFLVTKYTVIEIKDNFWFGIGLQNVNNVIGNKIHKDGFKYFEKINPHNQYLHFWLGLGFFGFIYFLILLFYFYKSQKHNPYFIVLFLLIMLTESILIRVKGISLFFFFSFLVSHFNFKLND